MSARTFPDSVVAAQNRVSAFTAKPLNCLALLLVLLVVEFAVARLVFALMETFPAEPTVAGATRSALSLETGLPAASTLAMIVHTFIKGSVAAAALWALLFGFALARERQRFAADSGVLVFNPHWLPLHLMSLALLIVTRAKLKGFPLEWFALTGAVLVAVYAASFTVFVLTVLRLLAPFGFWRRYLRRHRMRIAAVGGLCLVLTGGELLGVDSSHLETRFYDLLFALTAGATLQILTWWGYEVRFDLAAARLVVDQFSVIIGPECLGYQGMTITLVFITAYLYWNRASFRFPQSLLIYPTLMTLMFVANCIRIALLVAIGASWSPKVAVFGFHSAAGWVNLLLLLLLSVYILNRLSFFSIERTRFGFDISDGKLRLVPMIVLLAVAILSLLVSPGFEWPYPVRVLIVGGLLFAIRHRLALGSSLNPHYSVIVPVLVGVGVFLLWRAMVPEVPAQSASFAEHLQAAPIWISAGWLMFRFVGAVIVVPMAEELAFRGYLFDALVRELRARAKLMRADSINPRWFTGAALIVTSAGFGALHTAWVAGIAAGVIYGLVKLWRGKLMDAVIAHAVTNLLLAVQVLSLGAWSYW